MPIAPLGPIGRETVVDRLTDSLIDAVIAGRFEIGAPLPAERDLAEALEVNRATLRQAVARLEQIGLVSRRQGSGTVVHDPGGLTAPEIVGRMAASEQAAFLADLIEVREALAGVIGRRAGHALTADHRRQLRSLVADVESASTARDRQLLELAFFAVLVEAAGNRAIGVLLQWVEAVYDNLALPSIEPAFAEPATVVTDLRALLGAIESGGDLEEAMTRYARSTGERLLASLG